MTLLTNQKTSLNEQNKKRVGEEFPLPLHTCIRPWKQVAIFGEASARDCVTISSEKCLIVWYNFMFPWVVSPVAGGGTKINIWENMRLYLERWHSRALQHIEEVAPTPLKSIHGDFVNLICPGLHGYIHTTKHNIAHECKVNLYNSFFLRFVLIPEGAQVEIRMAIPKK